MQIIANHHTPDWCKVGANFNIKSAVFGRVNARVSQVHENCFSYVAYTNHRLMTCSISNALANHLYAVNDISV